MKDPLGREQPSLVARREYTQVTFISFLTATVTSYFVTVEQEAEQTKERELRAASDAETREALGRLEARLATIETMLQTRLRD